MSLEIRTFRRRKLVNLLASAAALSCVVVALIPLASILVEVAVKGHGALSWGFISNPIIPGGGIGNAILGTLQLVFYASLIGLPVGILTGIYVSEFGDNVFGRTIRFFNDVLANFPSIVIGLLAYSLFITYFGFSIILGAIALSIIMIPVVANTTEEALRMVPNSLREASLALGVPRWKTVLKVMISNGKAGMVTGALLAIARITGETAPILVTARYSYYWALSPSDPTASLPVAIWFNALDQSVTAQQEAWGAALILIILVLSLNIVVRLLTRRNRFSNSYQMVKKSWLRKSKQSA